MDGPHPPMSVLRPLSKPSPNYCQLQGTYINDYVPRKAHAQPVPQTRIEFKNVQQSYHHDGWTPDNYDPAQGSSPDRSVKFREIQSFQNRVTASCSHSQRGLGTAMPHLCRTKAALNEPRPHHKDIPLHRSPGKTDLTQSYPDVNEAKPGTFEVKPDTNDDSPNLCEVKPDHNFKSNRVFSLNRHNFRPFVDNTEIAMILFYEPDMPECSELLKKYSDVSTHFVII